MSAPSHAQECHQAPPSPFTFDPIPDAIVAIRRGEFVVVMDDEGRENEGDLVCAASKITTEGMAFMIRWTR
jgi:3,4-dihydroxy-2-butanone 4-phosphate synthase